MQRRMPPSSNHRSSRRMHDTTTRNPLPASRSSLSSTPGQLSVNCPWSDRAGAWADTSCLRRLLPIQCRIVALRIGCSMLHANGFPSDHRSTRQTHNARGQRKRNPSAFHSIPALQPSQLRSVSISTRLDGSRLLALAANLSRPLFLVPHKHDKNPIPQTVRRAALPSSHPTQKKTSGGLGHGLVRPAKAVLPRACHKALRFCRAACTRGPFPAPALQRPGCQS